MWYPYWVRDFQVWSHHASAELHEGVLVHMGKSPSDNTHYGICFGSLCVYWSWMIVCRWWLLRCLFLKKFPPVVTHLGCRYHLWHTDGVWACLRVVYSPEIILYIYRDESGVAMFLTSGIVRPGSPVASAVHSGCLCACRPWYHLHTWLLWSHSSVPLGGRLCIWRRVSGPVWTIEGFHWWRLSTQRWQNQPVPFASIASIVPPLSIISVHSSSTYKSCSVVDLLSINPYWSGLKRLFFLMCLIISSRIRDSINLHMTLVRLTGL